MKHNYNEDTIDDEDSKYKKIKFDIQLFKRLFSYALPQLYILIICFIIIIFAMTL